MTSLNARTRQHYESLLPDLETGYIEYRWRSHPLQRLHYLQTRRSLQNALAENLWQGCNMLEVGCGPGTWTDECLRYAGHLTLLDISPSMLREAHARFRDQDRVSLLCGDFTSGVLDRPRSFDAIVSVRAFEYMGDKLDAVRRFSRLLRPGGTLILVTKNPGWRDAKTDTGFAEREAESIHTDWIAWSRLGDLVREQGMDVVAIRPAAMGSYEPPFANSMGRWGCRVLHHVVERLPMSRSLDKLTESYLLVARRSAEAGNGAAPASDARGVRTASG